MQDALEDHLFCDGEEHGAVIFAGLSETDQQVRLLCRDLVLAKEGIDYVAGEKGYRMLTGKFVTEQIRHCRDAKLVYLAVHNHGGENRVGFSQIDMESHERGYPSLLDIAGGMPVGGLVFARNAVAGDIWFPNGSRYALTRTTVVGPHIKNLYPEMLPHSGSQSGKRVQRQTLLFGREGQAILQNLRVGVIGAGGVGSLIIQQLAHLGVKDIVVADPEAIEESNLSRVVGSLPGETTCPAKAKILPAFLRKKIWRPRPKVKIMERMVKRILPGTSIEAIRGDFVNDDIARRFADCDFLFLAADKFQARQVFNSMVQQYLIPGVQVGVKIPVDDKSTGEIGRIHAASRPVWPGRGCLSCIGLIPTKRLQMEAETEEERRRNGYIDDEEVSSASVIALNGVVASVAVNTFMLAFTGLAVEKEALDMFYFFPREKQRFRENEPSDDPHCLDCGELPSSRRGKGDGVELPTRIG